MEKERERKRKGRGSQASHPLIPVRGRSRCLKRAQYSVNHLKSGLIEERVVGLYPKYSIQSHTHYANDPPETEGSNEAAPPAARKPFVSQDAETVGSELAVRGWA